MKTKILISVISMFIISSSLAMQMQAGMQGDMNASMGNGMQGNMNGMQGSDTMHSSGTMPMMKHMGNGMQGDMMKFRKAFDFDCLHTVDGNMNGNMMIMATATMPTSTMNMAPETMASGSMMYMPALKLGDGKRNGKQEMVRMLQTRLISDGLLAGNASGYFGNATRSAVKKFQINQGMKVSGVVATTTMMKMREPCEGPGRNMKDGMGDHGMMQGSDSMRSSGTMPMMKHKVMMKNDVMMQGNMNGMQGHMNQ